MRCVRAAGGTLAHRIGLCEAGGGRTVGSGTSREWPTRASGRLRCGKTDDGAEERHQQGRRRERPGHGAFPVISSGPAATA